MFQGPDKPGQIQRVQLLPREEQREAVGPRWVCGSEWRVGALRSGSNLLCPPDEEKARQDPAYHLKTTNLETRETLAELYKDYKGDQLLASTMKEPEAKKTDKLNAVSSPAFKIKCT